MQLLSISCLGLALHFLIELWPVALLLNDFYLGNVEIVTDSVFKYIF